MLSESQVKQYHNEGYLLIDSPFSEEDITMFSEKF